jgi:hypothetical protein
VAIEGRAHNEAVLPLLREVHGGAGKVKFRRRLVHIALRHVARTRQRLVAAEIRFGKGKAGFGLFHFGSNQRAIEAEKFITGP